MPLVAGPVEVIDDHIFDTLHTMAPRVALRDREQMFVIPFGAQMLTNEGPRIKEQLETSMCFSGQLPAPQQFKITALRVVMIGRKIVPVSSRYYADTRIHLVIGSKTYWNGPAWKCADPVAMVLNADTLLAMGRHARLDLVRSLRRLLDPEVVIRTQESFYVEVSFGQAWREYADDAPERIVAVLEGKMLRAIM